MSPVPSRKIAGVSVSAIGYGAMSISGSAYSPSDVRSDDERFLILDAAHAAGCRNWDTADVYRDAEDLIGKW
jgi:aryl-alcohol dehydrogenase-like predicted oxidoreductase